MALQALFDMIRRFKIGYEVELHKRTVERGDCCRWSAPTRPAIAERRRGCRRVEHANAAVEIDGVAAVCGAHRYRRRLICDAADTDKLARTLRDRGAAPVCEDAAEIIRVEHGRPRYGVDLDETVIPQEAGLNERAVSFTKGCYVGQETVARLYYRGKPNRHLRGLRLTAPAEPGAELRLGERVGGTSDELRPLPRPRPDRPGARAPRGRAGSERLRRRARRRRRGGRAAVSRPGKPPQGRPG